MKVFKIPLPDPALRVSIRNGSKSQVIPLSEIIYCFSERNYTRIYLAGGNTRLSYKTMKNVKEKLEPHGFVLIHRSYMVNCMYIKDISLNGESFVTLSTGLQLPVSRRRKDALRRFLGEDDTVNP